MHETYDLTILETEVNTNRYMRWHTTFSHNVTSVLCENVDSVPGENSFQPPQNEHAEQEFKTMHCIHIGTTPMHVTCHYPHHHPSDSIASLDGITQHVVLFPGTMHMHA